MFTELQGAVRSLRRSPGFTFTALGTLALGIGAVTTVFTLLLAQLMTRLLYGITPADPVTFVVIAVAMAAVAVVACYLPARRATRVDPMVALRAE